MACIVNIEPDLPPCAYCFNSVYIDDRYVTTDIYSRPIKLCEHVIYHQDCLRRRATNGDLEPISCEKCNKSKLLIFVSHNYGFLMIWSWICVLLAIWGTLVVILGGATLLTYSLLQVMTVVLLTHFLAYSIALRDSYTGVYKCSLMIFESISVILGVFTIPFLLERNKNVSISMIAFVISLFLPILHWLVLLVPAMPECVRRMYYSFYCTELYITDV